MYTIKTINSISASGLAHFDDQYTIDPEATNEDGIIVRSATLHDMQFPKELKAIARAGAGVNNIPVERCAEEGIVVFNTPGANANAVKELVFCGLLMSARKIYEGISWSQSNDRDADVAKLVEKGKKNFAGSELLGKSIGIIGLGAIGIQVANLALKFGMKVYGYDPYISIDAAWNLSRSVQHAKTLEDIYRNCDYITVHVPLCDETKGFINAEAIAKMKDGVHLLNFARGGLLDDASVIESLQTGKVATYVTDFPTAQLLGVENVITIPHLGASTDEAEENCVLKAVFELKDFLENGNILNSVNFPNVTMERSGMMRIALIHKNIPKMLAKIADTLSRGDVNIENMINKSKKDYAYTLVDVNDYVDEKVLADLNAMEGIIRVNLYK